MIWTARPRIDHVVIFQASAPRISNAAALIALVAAGDLAAIVSAAAEGLAAATASAVADLVAAALEGLAAAVEASEAGGENYAWNFPVLFLEKLKPQTNHSKKRYEKTINTDRYRQYQHGPGTNIHIRSDCRQRE